MPMSHDSEAAPRFQRQFIEDTIENLIAYLDAFDGDPEAEPDHDAEDCSYFQPIYAGPCSPVLGGHR